MSRRKCATMGKGKTKGRKPGKRGVKVCQFSGYGNASQFGFGQAMADVTAMRGNFTCERRGRPRKNR